MKSTPKKETIDSVNSIFVKYLEEHNHRKTPERFSILYEIYSSDDHFDVESLYMRMKENNYTVSRATLYNTIELLINCNLVTKHSFGNNSSLYERSYKFRQHDHLICEDCGKIFEFCDPRILEIQKSLEAHFSMHVTNHALTFYAKCNTCETKKSKSTTKKN